MSQDPYSQNTNETYSKSLSPVDNEKVKLRRILLVFGVFVVLAVIFFVFQASQPQSQQSKYTESATAAARKQIRDASVKDVKVADGFALALVGDPNANGQARAGNTSVFKVNKDGSMKLLASASYFSPLNLLELGMPLATQAKLSGTNIDKVRQNLADGCGYNGGNTPGYSGFDGSFSPDAWEIDSATLSGLEQAVSGVVSSTNAEAKPGKAVVCINATQKNSNATTDTATYISTFTLQVQFVAADGTLSTHIITFATGPNYYRNYTLDGKTI